MVVSCELGGCGRAACCLPAFGAKQAMAEFKYPLHSTMSRTSSPAPDTASPVDPLEHSPRRDDPEPAEASGEPPSESSEHETKSAVDASASGSGSGSGSASSTAEPVSSSASEPVPGPVSAFDSTSSTAQQGHWQAVWSPAHNAYYFYNSVTHETTWTNPLQPNAEAGPSNTDDTSVAPSSNTDEQNASSSYDLYAAAAAQGIDPALAHLDPSLAAPGTNPSAFTYTAKFNARTGAFARPDGRDPTHLSEYERAKRMSEFYFDVNAWEQEVEQRKLEEAQEEEGKKRKRPTKKDLVSASFGESDAMLQMSQRTDDRGHRSGSRIRKSRKSWRRRRGCALRLHRLLLYAFLLHAVDIHNVVNYFTVVAEYRWSASPTTMHPLNS